MQTESKRGIYALVHTEPALAAAGHATMQAALSLAQRCQGCAHAVLVGPEPDAAIEYARALGLDSVWVITGQAMTGPLQAQQLADIFAAALAEKEAIAYTADSVFLLPASPAGEEIAGRLAARLKAVPLGKCKQFQFDASGGMSVQRAALGGRLNVSLACRQGPYVAVVRKPDEALQAGPADRPATAVHRMSCNAQLRPPYPITATARTEQHANLEGAKLVVSGGRGMGSEKGFTVLYELAAKLGGAVGGSLPAIDAGWAPVARQVGQSGKYVTPDIYLAIGISGTPQHLAGIDPHAKIIAVNKDADAGIFQAAHIGVVADWQEFVPALMNAWDKPQS